MSLEVKNGKANAEFEWQRGLGRTTCICPRRFSRTYFGNRRRPTRGQKTHRGRGDFEGLSSGDGNFGGRHNGQNSFPRESRRKSFSLYGERRYGRRFGSRHFSSGLRRNGSRLDGLRRDSLLGGLYERRLQSRKNGRRLRRSRRWSRCLRSAWSRLGVANLWLYGSCPCSLSKRASQNSARKQGSSSSNQRYYWAKKRRLRRLIRRSSGVSHSMRQFINSSLSS